MFDSHTVSFEEAGGHVARVFATGAGWSPERREQAERKPDSSPARAMQADLSGRIATNPLDA
ncbi:hypothetical protein ABZS29_25900 [Kribbella sp. NPDC005582]|uniref:hypothetical protein n=1 Tax=Kribbella sp. NPDC005582 TaxID=3156893 RepID=UPI0033B80EC4